jgi:prolyl oligopeptidase
MGLYREPLERFGALESEAWRAVRLVVDTGIHALGWTRQRSIDLLRERAGLSLLEAETETDRYISWPGQALSYMIGQREILALRAQLERRDGDRFDARAFHDETIGHGALPLSTLRARCPAG